MLGSHQEDSQFQKSLMEDEKIDKEEVWSAIRYLDPDEREKDKEIDTATINRSIGSSAYGWRCLGSTLASSKTTVISFTTDGSKISSDQCDRMARRRWAVSVFLDDKYCLVINLVFFCSFEQIVVFIHSEFKQSIADVFR